MKRACKRRGDAVQNPSLGGTESDWFIRQAKTQSVAAVSEQNSLIEVISVDSTAAKDELQHCRLKAGKTRRDFEISKVDRDWLEEVITLARLSLARELARTPSQR